MLSRSHATFVFFQALKSAYLLVISSLDKHFVSAIILYLRGRPNQDTVSHFRNEHGDTKPQKILWRDAMFIFTIWIE